jgi:preprotein translocase subunit SecG
MGFLTVSLYIVHVIVSFFLIAIVLLQQGKGADLSVFGGGATQTAFGARGATTLLHKLTVYSFIAFICTTVLIGLVQSRDGGAAPLNNLPPAESALTEEPAAAPATPPAGAPATETTPVTAEPTTTTAPETPAPPPAAEQATPPPGGGGN